MVFFFYATTEQQRQLLESSVGPCAFCQSKGRVDIVEQRSKMSAFGLFPMSDTVERLALCQRCGKSIKEVHYNLRDTTPPTFTVSENGTKVEQVKESDQTEAKQM